LATKTTPSLSDIEEARARLDGVVHASPVYGSETLSRYTDRAVSLKAENLQRTGSFKIRGAVNKLATLTEAERSAGVDHGAARLGQPLAECRSRLLHLGGVGRHPRSVVSHQVPAHPVPPWRLAGAPGGPFQATASARGREGP